MLFSRSSIVAAVCSILMANVSHAQVTFTYNFGTTGNLTAFPTSTTGSGVTGGEFAIGNSNGTVSKPLDSSTTSSSSGYAGVSGEGFLTNTVGSGALNLMTTAYYGVTINSGGTPFTLTQFDFGSRSVNSGPQLYSLRSNADGFATDIASGGLALGGIWTLKTNSPAATLAGVNPVEFRLYTYGGTGSTSPNSRIDDVTITVNPVGIPVPEPSTIFAVGAGVLAVGRLLRRRRYVS
jgi:hypothetical protein